MLIEGACHCGNIHYELGWPEGAAQLARRECGCTFCRKHGAGWTSHPDAALLVQVADTAALQKYRFGTGTADFYICTGCGVVPLACSDIDGHCYAVVNVNTIEPAANVSFTTVKTDFDGEQTDARLDRRASNWIAAVRFQALSK